MVRTQARAFEDAGEDENRKAQKKCCVYKYIRVGQNLGERFCGNRMLKCLFCGHEFQGNQFVAGRHFRQGKGCPEVNDEALVDIHYNTDYKLDGKILELMRRFEELHNPAPVMDPCRDEGGLGQERDDEDVIDVDNVMEEGARAGLSERDRRKGVVSEPGGQQGEYFKDAHVSARAQAHVGADEARPSTGKRKERHEGARPGAQKRLRQNTIKESYCSQWQTEFKKKWMRFVYSQRLAFNIFRSELWLDVVRHFRELPGPVKVLWPSENEIVDIETVVRTADDVVADLAEVRAPFYVTGATIMSDGRKSRDAKPIVNFLAAGSRGVMLVRTMNREGERDQAEDVLARWIKVFDDFPRMHVCNKMLSDIGCSSAWTRDIIMRGRAVVRFIKEHGAALYIFKRESTQMGLIYPCETHFASVFAMMEHLLAVRSALERTVDSDSWGMVPWDRSVRQLARWVRWQVRHGPWWDSMTILFRIMEPMYDLLRRLDHGGLHMSRVVQWTQDVIQEVAQEVRVLPPDSAHFIVQKVQARCAHMLEPAHAAAHLLCPNRRDLRYYEDVVSDYDASLVREAEVYTSSQKRFDVASPEYETACAQMCDFHTRRGSIAWGGRDGDREAQRCTGDVETYEAGCWWSKWGQCAPQLQVIALRFMYIWTCSSPAERNWAVHEGVQTKKCNRLEFEKVAKLVEISANVRLLSHQRAGRGFALLWTLDESLLDVEAGIGTRPSWKGTDDRRTQEELECQSRSWQRDPYGSRAPLGEVADVFGTRAATLRPYTRDDDSDYEGQEQEDEWAGPTAATTAAQEADEWSDPEDVRRRSGGDDFFVGVDLEGEAEVMSRLLRRLAGTHLGILARSGCRRVAEEVMPHGESESRGDISVGMHAVMGEISALRSESFSPAMRAEFMSSAPEAEGVEDCRPPAETSAERLDRLDSRRACLMARADPRTQELAHVAFEERQRQLGTFTLASVGTRGEAALADASRMGGDVEQGSHETGFAPPEDPRVVPDRPSHDEQRQEDSLHEGAGMPLATGLVAGAADPIALTTGVEEDVAGDVDVTGAGRDGAQVDSEVVPREDVRDGHDGDRQETPQTLVVRTAVGPVVPHQGPFLVDLGRRAHGGGPVAERRVGRGTCAPSVPTFASSRERPQIRYVATPRGSLPFGCMTAEELEAHGGMDLTEIDRRCFKRPLRAGRLAHVQDLSWGPASPSLPSGGSVAAPSHGATGPSSPASVVGDESGSLTPRSAARRRRDTTDHARVSEDSMLFGRTDRPWSETRRVTTASAARQPGLREVSMTGSRRDVVASGFGGRGGDSGGMPGRCEGSGGATGGGADPPLTYGLREASLILQEPEVVTKARQAQHVPLDRRQEGETSGADGLPMRRDSRRHVDLAAAGIPGIVRGRRVIMDDDPDEAPEPSIAGRGGQRQIGRARGTGRSHGQGSHRSRRDSHVDDDR
ncbi:hypothetical protein CBR_g60040 [Chara braunii]|uniref:HAT C-terminal dimerisation domain-containing protein n=1 Tax=Chara braunii TaxID=69332 RepID=A0A388K8L3_CHABU|nr:hypothetical protein CBR_g60040 [Chara braunii]|eukprot:GBG66388.1 hypothetical protein CBR_g60040 [Chara braunii]